MSQEDSPTIVSEDSRAAEKRGAQSPADRAEVIHEARKAIKRMRALARLLRREIGEQEFGRVNASLRAAGRRLAPSRDAEVRLATLRELHARHSSELDSEQIEKLLQGLERERATAATAGPELSALADIAQMRHELSRWNMLDHDFEALSAGLRLIYRDGRRRYRRVRRDRARDPQGLHDWRKRVKALYYTLEMLGASRAKRAGKHTRQADRLGDVLGEEHDLWMLAAYLADAREPLCEGRLQQQLLELIERRRARLRKRALKLGAQLYARKPRKLVERVAKHSGPHAPRPLEPRPQASPGESAGPVAHEPDMQRQAHSTGTANKQRIADQ